MSVVCSRDNGDETKKGDFSPSSFVVLVPKAETMIPLRIDIEQDGIGFSAVPGQGEEGEEEALQLIENIKSEMAGRRMVIECQSRHIDVGKRRIDRVWVATA